MMLLSSGADQLSYPHPEKKHSVFSYYLLQGLAGKAANNGDGVTVKGLAGYIRDQMKRWSLQTGKMQTPQFIGKTNKKFYLIDSESN